MTTGKKRKGKDMRKVSEELKAKTGELDGKDEWGEGGKGRREKRGQEVRMWRVEEKRGS